ncbi:unnamed protein product, partial [Ectocarpus fasciculatus]
EPGARASRKEEAYDISPTGRSRLLAKRETVSRTAARHLPSQTIPCYILSPLVVKHNCNFLSTPCVPPPPTPPTFPFLGSKGHSFFAPLFLIWRKAISDIAMHILL